MSSIHIDKELDTEVDDANSVGEMLRNYIFVDDEKSKYFDGRKQYGCYETFKIRPEAIEIEEEDANELVDKYIGSRDEGVNARAFKISVGNSFDPILITVAWYWNADGWLMFVGPDFTIINEDCKKATTWYYTKPDKEKE